MIIRLDDCPVTSWKNGLGSTRKIAVHPAHAGMDDFIWRVSIANVDSAAPFSRFPGIDRHIVLLDGAGFTMQLDDDRNHALTTPYEPFVFPGEANVNVTLVDGPTRDFNLMVRRSHANGSAQSWNEAGTYQLDRHTRLLHCAAGRLEIGDATLHTGDSWLNTSSAQVRLQPGAVALVVIVEERATPE